jgi:hypothetical protein
MVDSEISSRCAHSFEVNPDFFSRESVESCFSLKALGNRFSRALSGLPDTATPGRALPEKLTLAREHKDSPSAESLMGVGANLKARSWRSLEQAKEGANPALIRT